MTPKISDLFLLSILFLAYVFKKSIDQKAPSKSSKLALNLNLKVRSEGAADYATPLTRIGRPSGLPLINVHNRTIK